MNVFKPIFHLWINFQVPSLIWNPFMGWLPFKVKIYESGYENLTNYESTTWKLNSHESWNWKLKNHKGWNRKLKYCESGIENLKIIKVENHTGWNRKFKYCERGFGTLNNFEGWNWKLKSHGSWKLKYHKNSNPTTQHSSNLLT